MKSPDFWSINSLSLYDCLQFGDMLSLKWYLHTLSDCINEFDIFEKYPGVCSSYLGYDFKEHACLVHGISLHGSKTWPFSQIDRWQFYMLLMYCIFCPGNIVCCLWLWWWLLSVVVCLFVCLFVLFCFVLFCFVLFALFCFVCLIDWLIDCLFDWLSVPLNVCLFGWLFVLCMFF